ncbi:trehalose synthase [Thermosulfidibacter takaii ABI70S6]|uniref:Trehalose synthase n=1 Tax=Thermosulfidibacter takaii (strain DSM 17441 / JCM 13301 / NBRC 103674 / ABI70S6) TaxID=1298851 RepID=A0A0S3QTM2_THET7|nr:glycosyltransferase [Thermosulfidibacter takaii]BAT71633.1 trehalose synthase [Thermosulfidibacter takaii ABI70S6]
MGKLAKLAEIVGAEVVEQLFQLAHWLKDITVVHINSTKEGGGVAEILRNLVPLMQELGIDAHWEVIEGTPEFFKCTKSIHNALHGHNVVIPERLLEVYKEVNKANAEKLKDILNNADIVFIHDPQPAALIEHFPHRKGRWLWRCHIDVSKPQREIWKFLKGYVEKYDGSIFHLASFAKKLSHPMYLIPPSIDPLGEKNMPLEWEEVKRVYESFNIDLSRPILLQVSRFDRLKDPIGVIQAYRLTKKFFPSVQLVLAGGGATDDPEGQVVLQEVKAAANGDPDIHVLFLPTNDRLINALQRGATIIIQKSIREGFGLTVTEGMWKYKPVIGGDTGGIRLQVINHHTGFLVNTPEGAALRMRYLLSHPDLIEEMGRKAHNYAKENFLITRHLRDYLSVMISQIYNIYERLELV